MLFSVVIPLYNKENYIERAVRSVLTQSHQDFEIWVINDGSTDKGPDIVKNIKDDRVKLVSQNNGGVSSARNKGITLARADIVAFLDADDVWLPHFLETILGLRKKYPDAGMYATGFRILKNKGIYRDIRIRNRKEFYGNYFDLVKLGGAVFTGCVAIPRVTFSRAGNFRVGHAMQEDLDMWFRIGVHYNAAYSSRVCSLYYYDLPGSACNIYGHRNKSPLLISFIEGHGKGQQYGNIENRAAQYVAYIEYQNIMGSVFAGETLQLKETLRRYRNLFGRNMYYYELLTVKQVPLIVLQKGKRLKLCITAIFLKYYIAFRYRDNCSNENRIN